METSSIDYEYDDDEMEEEREDDEVGLKLLPLSPKKSSGTDFDIGNAF